jgi:nucleoside-diphosphate-sugar epimerase
MNTFQDKRILVTGAQGFLGSILCDSLEKYTTKIYRLDKDYAGNNEFAAYTRMYKTDLYTEPVPKVLFHLKFDYIFHFASPCSIIQYKDNKYSHEEAIVGFHKIKELAEATGAKLVIPSTGSLSASTINEYAKTKQYFEDNIKEDDFCYRIYASFGYEEKKGKLASVIYQFCKAAILDEEIVIWGDGEQKRDFIFVGRVIDSMIKLIESDIHRADIASFEQHSFNEVLAIIEKTLDKKLKVKYIEKPEGYLNETKATNKQIDIATDFEQDIRLTLYSTRTNPRAKPFNYWH